MNRPTSSPPCLRSGEGTAKRSSTTPHPIKAPLIPLSARGYAATRQTLRYILLDWFVMPRQKLFSVSIKDCRVECIASTGGAGGQNKNRRHTAVRIVHEPSGAVGFSADERDQLRNKRAAFRRMAESPSFRAWTRLVASELVTGKSIEQQVEEEMAPERLKIDVKDDKGRWVKLNE